MLDQSLPTTLQYQLKTRLLERIGSDWKPGTKISSEREICEEYGVSRMTVRVVLGELEREGCLIRKQGKGTFVSQPKYEQKLGGFYSFSSELEKDGLRPTTRVIGFQSIPCPQHVAGKLELQAGAPVWRVERLRYIDGDLFAWECSYLPGVLCPGITRERVEEAGLYRAIRDVSGMEAEEAEEDFEAVNCPEEAEKLLEVGRNAAVLRLTRLTRAGETCIEYCESLIRGDKYRYKVVLK